MCNKIFIIFHSRQSSRMCCFCTMLPCFPLVDLKYPLVICWPSAERGQTEIVASIAFICFSRLNSWVNWHQGLCRPHRREIQNYLVSWSSILRMTQNWAKDVTESRKSKIPTFTSILIVCDCLMVNFAQLSVNEGCRECASFVFFSVRLVYFSFCLFQTCKRRLSRLLDVIETNSSLRVKIVVAITGADDAWNMLGIRDVWPWPWCIVQKYLSI